MKKGLIAAVLACTLSTAAFALDANIDKGNLSANVGLNFGWGIGLAGGVEYDFTRFDIGNVLPITIGGAARASFQYANYWGYSYSTLDLGGFVTGHVSFKGLDLPADMKKWTDRLDYYIGLGIGFNLMDSGYLSSYLGNYGKIGFAGMSGVNYFLNKNLAINLEGGTLGWAGYGLIGILFKF